MNRYSIAATGQPGAKARLRTALKLMGFDGVRIEEKEHEAQAPVPRPDNIPTSAEAKAVADLYGRKHETPWAEEEIKAFKAAVKTGLLTLENMMIVTAFYNRERKKPEHFCRTSLLTFCRHFGTEIDKAKAAKPTRGKALEWTPANIIPIAQDPEEQERIRAAAAAGLRETKRKLGGNGA